MRFLNYFCTLLMSIMAASTLAAQDSSCDRINSIDQLVGGYNITNGPGQLINVPSLGVIPAPARASSTATLTKYGSDLGLDSNVFGDMTIDFVLVDDPDQMWEFSDNEVFGGISSDDLAIVLSNENTPPECLTVEGAVRMLGTGTTVLDIGERKVTLRLTVFPDGSLVGRMDVTMTEPNITLQTRIVMLKTS